MDLKECYPDFEGFQKLMNYEKAPLKKIEYPMFGSEKFDGVFCAAFKINGRVHIFSRTGKEYFSMEHIAKALEEQVPDLMWGEHGMVLFEAYSRDEDQPTISGWARDTKNQHPELMAMCHKFVHFNTVTYFSEYELSLPLVAVNHFLVHDHEEAMKKANEIWSRGGEGLVLEDGKLRYFPNKRNYHALKIKQHDTYDLRVVGLAEGKGKYEGMVGALICMFGDKTEITCGGMTDEQRASWWFDPSLIVGKIVEVAAMKSSTKGVLREPRFKSIRYDKDEPTERP